MKIDLRNSFGILGISVPAMNLSTDTWDYHEYPDESGVRASFEERVTVPSPTVRRVVIGQAPTL